MPNDFETITASDPDSPPRPEVPMLVGLPVGRIRVDAEVTPERVGPRHEPNRSFEKSLDQLIEYSRKATLEGSGEAISPRIKVIAYGFGFENPPWVVPLTAGIVCALIYWKTRSLVRSGMYSSPFRSPA